MTEFLIGALAGLILIAALHRLPIFARLMLATAALSLVAILIVGGVPALIRSASAAVAHLRTHAPFLQGAALAKLGYAAFSFRSGRSRRA